MLTLTGPQVHGLYALFLAKVRNGRTSFGAAIPKGRFTDDDASRPWAMRVESRVAAKLVALGLARQLYILPHAREIRGADLARFFGHWETKFEITPRGLKFWQRLPKRDRHGYGNRVLPTRYTGST